MSEDSAVRCGGGWTCLIVPRKAFLCGEPDDVKALSERELGVVSNHVGTSWLRTVMRGENERSQIMHGLQAVARAPKTWKGFEKHFMIEKILDGIIGPLEPQNPAQGEYFISAFSSPSLPSSSFPPAKVCILIAFKRCTSPLPLYV